VSKYKGRADRKATWIIDTHTRLQVLVNLPSFSSEVCRRVVQKYHSEEKIARRIIEVASELLQRA
jgi:peroxiredoxin